MIYAAKKYLAYQYTGYIAGTQDGIVTVGVSPASRQIVVLDIHTLAWVATVKSLDNGHYLITGLDPSRKYLVIARDYKGDYEPVAWDYVRPATDLTLDEQQALWQSWQS